MKKISWKFESKVRLFPYFGKRKFKKVIVKDSKLYINERIFNEDVKILKEGNYKYSVKNVFPKWLILKDLNNNKK